MNTQEMNLAAQKIIDFKLNSIKFAVIRNYRQSTESEIFCSTWMNKISDKVNKEIKDILDLTDGDYSFLNVAVASMKGTKIKAKTFF